jgi:hypothetical protein
MIHGDDGEIRVFMNGAAALRELPGLSVPELLVRD